MTAAKAERYWRLARRLCLWLVSFPNRRQLVCALVALCGAPLLTACASTGTCPYETTTV